jgi:hypothetical protein
VGNARVARADEQMKFKDDITKIDNIKDFMADLDYIYYNLYCLFNNLKYPF